jgi:tRNA (mo5U34)-methyltransferase
MCRLAAGDAGGDDHARAVRSLWEDGMSVLRTMTRDELRQKVDQYTWAHSIDLGDGVVTKGVWGPQNPFILQVFDGIDFRGKKVLDIGCWDGLWSFEAEKRGAAEVYATDDCTQRDFPEQPTLLLAREALNSQIKYIPDISVNDIQRLDVYDFDVVIFTGIYYHLKNPLLALARLRQVMKEGGIIVVEGEVIRDSKQTYARFFYGEKYHNDDSNWWIPTIPCLHQWVECSYFEVLTGNKYWDRPGTEDMARYLLSAKAVRRRDSKYRMRDEDLWQFDLHDYRLSA